VVGGDAVSVPLGSAVVIVVVGVATVSVTMMIAPVLVRSARRTPTEVRRIEASTAWLSVVAAAATPYERDGAVLERESDLLGEAIVGVAPVREERAPVLAELFAEGRHGSMVRGAASRPRCFVAHAWDARLRA
jgi:hypothetical protein